MNFFVVAAAAAVLVWSAGACETGKSAPELAADRTRAVEFFGPKPQSLFGREVFSAGDLNGDGLDDFVISSPYENGNMGAIYVFFGRRAEAWANATFDFNTTDPTSWIRITGAISNMLLGAFDDTHGDFNGDGLGDLLLSTYCGMAYCVFGHRGEWRSFNTTEIEDGAVPGFAIFGSASVLARHGGDSNGDGIEDLLISIPSAFFSYVIYGVASQTRSNFNISNVDGTNGFQLTDGMVYLGSGGTMGPIGDVNGDGLADLALGSYNTVTKARRVYVLFSRNVSASGQAWPALLNLSTYTDGTNGFIVEGPGSSQLGHNVISAGDLNADGFTDIFIGSNAATAGAWILFGHASPWAPLLNSSLLDGTDGFHFAPPSASQYWGFSGGGIGDVNGDGVDDIIIGGPYSRNSTGEQTGSAAILFGHNGSWPAELALNDVVGSGGFVVYGPSAGSNFGISAHGSGDFNGDGRADFIVGGRYHDSNTGYALLVFGVEDDHCEVCSNTTSACLVCSNGFILNGTFCEAVPEAFSWDSDPASAPLCIFSAFAAVLLLLLA